MRGVVRFHKKWQVNPSTTIIIQYSDVTGDDFHQTGEYIRVNQYDNSHKTRDVVKMNLCYLKHYASQLDKRYV